MLTVDETSSRRTILGYNVGETLGIGSTSVVKLGINKNNVCAIKIVSKLQRRSDKKNDAANRILMFKKEILTHQLTNHQNIIKAIEATEDSYNVYFLLEYAVAGELFERIVPDRGLHQNLVHMYFKQLLSGVAYLHSVGIAHRDLKPENMLLDFEANLKITDFGLAAKFYDKHGNIRTLTTPCGTPPYVAPDIHTREYSGPQVDIWSCGIILYVLLAGNTPWGEPTEKDEDYLHFVKNHGNLQFEPWNTFPPTILCLLYDILTPNPIHRIKIEDIALNPWVASQNSFLSQRGICIDPSSVASLMWEKMDIGQQPLFVSYSQPETLRGGIESQSSMDCDDVHGMISFSQPPCLRKGSADQSPDENINDILSQCRRRFCDLLPAENLTRFFSLHEEAEIFRQISVTFTEMVVPSKINVSARKKLQFQTTDKRMCPLNGEVLVQRTGDLLSNLVVFRRTKGDPIEFTRFYNSIMANLEALLQ